MKRSWWRTGPPLKHQQPIAPLRGGHLLRQVIVLALVLVIWGGGLALFLSTLPTAIATPLAQVPPTVTSEPVPTNTAVPATPTAQASATIEPTATSTPSDTPTTAATETPASTNRSSAMSFQADVQPIFKQVCSKCHGGEKTEEGLSLLTYADVMRGSDNGPVIVPGDAANSLLAQQVEKGEMPKRGPKLLPKQIQAIVAWINAGAPDN